MDPSIPIGSQDAQKQWQELHDIYKDVGFDVHLIRPVEGLPDMVFTANGFFSIDNKAVVARYRYPQRQGETEYYIQWLKDRNFKVIDPGQIYYEGEGDTFLVGNTIFQGWGFRSDKKVVELMKKTFPEKNGIALHLIDDRFYHLDTCFFPVNEELVYYYDKAFDTASQKAITKAFKHAVAVSDEEALGFALNSMTVDHTVITNTKSKKFVNRVKSDGYQVVTAHMTEFLKSGGSVKCLTNEIWTKD